VPYFAGHTGLVGRAVHIDRSLDLASAEAIRCILGLVTSDHIVGSARNQLLLHREEREPVTGLRVTHRGNRRVAGYKHCCNR
jgi:hypothetical protein